MAGTSDETGWRILIGCNIPDRAAAWARLVLRMALILAAMACPVAAEADAGAEERDLSDEMCVTCHVDEGPSRGVHKDKPCIGCHTDVTEVPHEKEPAEIKCTLCHVSMGGKNLGMDVHERARKSGNLNAPDCTGCHGSHDIPPRTSKDSTMNRDNMESFCKTCHSGVKAEEIYHGEVELPAEMCQGCHGDRGSGTPFVDSKQYSRSVHKVLECVDCHRDVGEVPHGETLEKVACGKCHEGPQQLYEGSVHGAARAEGIEDAPLCQDCHGSHGILPGREAASVVAPKNVAHTCGNGKCHGSEAMARKYNIPIANPFALYEKSVHAEKQDEGMEAANCQKCHGSHDILPLTDPRSKVFKGNVAKTCSQCHKDTYEQFVQSIHWRGYLKGVREAPVCSDCHLEHDIAAPENPKSSVFRAKVPNLCTDCHENSRIAERYGIEVMKLESYLKSYHGLASRSGNLEAANCTSCHEKHMILPSSDPRSTTNSANLNTTCGACHLGMTGGLSETKIHAESPGIGGKVVEIVRLAYIWLICLACAFMVIFNLTDLVAKTRRRTAAGLAHEEGERTFKRFNRVEILIHWTLFLSFALLVYTGFAYIYSEGIIFWPLTKWAHHTVRDNLHRIGGVVLIVVMGMQMVLMIVTRRGRGQLAALFPRPRDAGDLGRLYLHNLNANRKPPHFYRYTVMEKFEYWALVWGATLMAATGLGLWFKDAVLSQFPSWVIDLFVVLHLYEAVLATLAILLWHFYWTVFNPVVYPMDTSWITGKISEKHLKHERPGEWERIQKFKDNIVGEKEGNSPAD